MSNSEAKLGEEQSVKIKGAVGGLDEGRERGQRLPEHMQPDRASGEARAVLQK